jgi:hypothetical protein
MCTLRFTATNPKIESFLCHIASSDGFATYRPELSYHESAMYVLFNGCIVYNSVSWLSAMLFATHRLERLDDQLNVSVS